MQRARHQYMRPPTILKILVLGIAVQVFLRYRRRRSRVAGRDSRVRRADPFASDPRDPVQGFDEVSELQVTPLDIDAQSLGDVEAARDLASLESEVDEIAAGDTGAMSAFAAGEPARRDAGDLYGGHTPSAVDRRHPDDDRAFDEGQNWLEALETSAIENGAEPGRELGIIDDEDVLRPPHASDARDVPVADYGSGGRRGL
jgi:hypothetical protein